MTNTEEAINVEGSLDDILKKLDPKTLWHGEQIVAKRIEELKGLGGVMNYAFYPTLAAKDFFLPNVLYFTVEGNAPFLYIGRSHVNPLLESSEARAHFRREGLYVPSSEESKRITSDPLTKRIPLLELRFKQYTDIDQLTFRAVEIDRGKYTELNPAGRLLADSLFGDERQFNEQQELIRRVNSTCDAWIIIDSPKNILEIASSQGGFCRIGVMHCFGNESSVYLNIGRLDYRYGAHPTYMCGQPKRVT